MLLATQEAFDLGLPMALIFGVLFIFIFLIVLIRRYKRCPSDRILVVYGKVGGGAIVTKDIKSFLQALQ